MAEARCARFSLNGTEHWCLQGLQVQHVKGCSVAQGFKYSDYNAAQLMCENSFSG